MLRKIVKRSLNYLSNNDYETLNQIEINSERVLANVNLISALHKNFSTITVLKANGYGHGLSTMAKILNQADLAFIAVDGYFEAAEIRDISKHRILVMGYIKPSNVRLIDIRKCSFVIQDIKGLEALASLNKPVNVHLELNTGMNRLGLSEAELVPYLKTLRRYPKLNLEGVMTHLADADNGSDDSYTKAQAKRFDEFVETIKGQGFDPRYIHIAQTAGSAKAKSKYANSIRLGIGLYGINPLEPNDPSYRKLRPLEPVLELKSTIIKCVDLEKGDRVSYNGIFTAPRAMRIGVLPLGYYEGLPRELSNKGVVTYKNKALPIVGRVCMNHTMIDLSGTNLRVGSEITVISSDKAKSNSALAICKKHGLFSYTLVTGLSNSVRRIIV